MKMEKKKSINVYWVHLNKEHYYLTSRIVLIRMWEINPQQSRNCLTLIAELSPAEVSLRHTHQLGLFGAWCMISSVLVGHACAREGKNAH